MQQESITLLEFQNRITSAIKKKELQEVWIRCEITDFNTPNHVYIELTQTENNRMVAKQKAMIWANKKDFILNKFQTGTGTPLQKNIDVLICVTVKHNPVHGVSLDIIDIEPSFTVGKLQLKIQEIENALITKGVFDKNKAFQLPEYFNHVAVLTPKGSAGEGDFKKEADLLEEVQLCKFSYFYATMQGLQAEESMSEKIAAINIAHAEQQFDALIIIRGGGAVADLSWLNNFKSANFICHSKLPVICGLGHDRDISILCKVANQNLGTPSKCISFITKSNIKSIELGKQNLLRLESQFTNKKNQLTSIANAQISHVQTAFSNQVLSAIKLSDNQHNLLYRTFRNGVVTGKGIKNKTQSSLSDTYRDSLGRIGASAQEKLKNIKNSFSMSVKHKSSHSSELKKTLDNLMRQAPIKLLEKIFSAQARGLEVNKQITNVARRNTENQLNTLQTTFSQSIQREVSNTVKRSVSLNYAFFSNLKSAKSNIKSLTDNIFLMQPKRILEKGYALIRNSEGKVITKASQAKDNQLISIEFQDNKLNAKIGNNDVSK